MLFHTHRDFVLVAPVKFGARARDSVYIRKPARVTDLFLRAQEISVLALEVLCPRNPLSLGHVLWLLSSLLTAVPGDSSFHSIPFCNSDY